MATAYGQFAVPTASVGVTMNGLSKEGKLREAFGFTGLTILENMEHRGACGHESNTADGPVITLTQVVILVVTVLSLGGLLWLVNHTKLGRAMRATAENPRVAGLMGVAILAA